MSGLQNFLAPFSHLIFANRNFVIVLLCIVLFLAAFDALFHRWKTQRLHHDLTAAKSSGGYGTSGRRYTSAAAEEPAREPGGPLPPVKGGRTYARNLGSALQKAGMSGPQIYSPPTPPGWAANTNAGQPPQPAMPSPYPGPATPWGAPPAPQTPWAFQGGAGRPGQGPAASPIPMYQPPPAAPPAPPGPPAGLPQPSAPSVPGPGLYSPPSQLPGAYTPQAPAFGQPAFPIPATGSNAPAPPFAPSGPPNPQMMTPLPAAPPQEPAAPDAGRRGKPKRRRFNFNVLENLEKMVQPKPAEPLPSSSWTPPPAPPAPAAAQPGAAPQQPPGATEPPTPPAAEQAFPAKAVTPDAPTLPLQFGVPAAAKTAPAAEPAFDQSTIETSAPETEQTALEPASDAEPATVSEPEGAAEPETEPEPEPKVDARRSMRSMMFGEEVAAPDAAATESEQAPAREPESSAAGVSETSTGSADSSWASYPWSRHDEASSSTEEAMASETAADGQPAEGETPQAEPVAESTASDGFDPWAPSYTTEPEATEPVSTLETPRAGAADAGSQPPDQPGRGDSDQPSAGRLVIIEDDPTAASYYATLFRGNGYQVEVANDGVSGVDLATRTQPQVILLDVMMPRQNGILVLQTLRASDETKNTPVVVMSNFSEPTLIKRALQLGALEYVIKTQVEGPALLNAVPRWMNRERAFAAA